MNIERLNSVDQLKNDWDLLANSIYQKRSFLAHLEKNNFSNQRYYVLYEDGFLCAGAVVYSLKINLFTFAKLDLNVPMQIIGLPISNDENGLLGSAEYTEILLSEIFKQENGIALCLNYQQPVLNKKLIKMSSLPSMILRREHEDWESYLQSLRHPYRRRILNALAKTQNIRSQSESCNAFTDDHYNQYLQVIHRSKTKLEVMGMKFFKNLPDPFKLDSFYDQEKLLYWHITVEDQNNYYFLFGGLNYELRDVYDSYTNNLIAILKRGINRQYNLINLGQTAETSKARFGTIREPKKMFLYHKSRLARFVFHLLRKQLSHSPESHEHHVFRNDEIKKTNPFIDEGDRQSDKEKNYTKPYLQDLLSLLKLDKNYCAAKGNYLYSHDQQQCRQILDLAGGFGSVLLGHNHPELVKTAKLLLENKRSFHHQVSRKSKLNALCKKINELIKSHTQYNYTTIILNTGAEAVEASIKHALLVFDNKLLAIEKEIEKSLVNINESHFFRYPDTPLIYNAYEFDTLDAVRSYLKSLNSNIFENHKPKLIASNRSFHGKTLGALAVTSNPSFRNPFVKNTAFETIFLDINAKCPEQLFRNHTIQMFIPHLKKNGVLSFKKRKLNLIAASIIEPIIGEGGIHVVSKKFLSDLRKYTKQHNIPLIFDEIQSGCFRTGKFLASFYQKVEADYYILGKSLGGGLSKISAVSIQESQYVPEFDLLHSSTFAEDDFSSVIASRSLDLLVEHQFRIKKASTYLFTVLTNLKQEYPELIHQIRGVGLMIGIEFKSMEFSSSFGLQGIYRSPYFGYLLSAYLLNKKNIRVSVTLSDAKTLRLLPSLFIDETQIDELYESLADLCKILQFGDFYSLVSFLLPEKYQHLRSISNFSPQTVPLDDDSNSIDQVGFLIHYIDMNTVRAYLPSLDVLPDQVVISLIRKLSDFSEPVIIGRNSIKNIHNQEICITFIGLAFTAKMITDDLRKSLGNIYNYQKICNKGIDLLLRSGITKIGLGQYNSIIMQNGKAISNSNIRVTTGNGFTSYAVIQKIEEAIRTRHHLSTKLGIIGAGGNIARVLSAMLLDKVDEIMLMGRSNGNHSKLKDHAGYLIYETLKAIENECESTNPIYDQIRSFSESSSLFISRAHRNHTEYWDAYNDFFPSNKKIDISTDLKTLSDCDLILVATSDPSPFLNQTYFKKGALICDISVPLNCEEELLKNPDYKVFRGGLIELPHAESLYPPGLSLENGQAYACMVETMLMGFEHAKGCYSFGEINKDQVNDLGNRLKRNGFMASTIEQELYH